MVLRVLVWNEGRHEKTEPDVARRYPDGIHGAVAAGIRAALGDGARVAVATLDDPGQGLTEESLAATDVLTWWGHRAHDEVTDENVERVRRHVLAGMGLVMLHSGHFSKSFKALMGTSCTLRWRDGDDRELVWTVDPTHPIAAGVPQPDRHRRAGDVRRVLRHPGPRRARLHQLVHRRRGVPQRLHVPARPRQGLLLQPR